MRSTVSTLIRNLIGAESRAPADGAYLDWSRIPVMDRVRLMSVSRTATLDQAIEQANQSSLGTWLRSSPSQVGRLAKFGSESNQV